MLSKTTQCSILGNAELELVEMTESFLLQIFYSFLDYLNFPINAT